MSYATTYAPTLFDSPPVVEQLDISAGLDSLAFLYTATDAGNNSGIRFMLTRDEAEIWCSSPVSCGTLHGTRWAYFFTTVANFIRHHQGDDDAYGSFTPTINLQGLHDSGEWDERIADLGLTKIGFSDFADVLGPLGVEVVA